MKKWKYTMEVLNEKNINSGCWGSIMYRILYCSYGCGTASKCGYRNQQVCSCC